MGKKVPSRGISPENPWNHVRLHKGRLSGGILTDDLARNTVPWVGDPDNNTIIPTKGNLGIVKVHKKPPSKFK